MKLERYRKLKAVLDTEEAKNLHCYDFIGTREITDGSANYRIKLFPDEKYGAIHCIFDLVDNIRNVSNWTSMYMSSRVYSTKAPSKAMHCLCII